MQLDVTCFNISPRWLPTLYLFAVVIAKQAVFDLSSCVRLVVSFIDLVIVVSSSLLFRLRVILSSFKFIIK